MKKEENKELKPNGKIHPVAELFPMMSDEELQELAEDIKANGLNNPIVLDTNGTLVDGRNRDAACKLAKVQPRYTLLNGQDATAFILSQNIARRHLNQGQRAILVAKAELVESTSYGDTRRLAKACCENGC